MSKGQTPRTPEHFPRMKYRAAKRHARNRPLAKLARALTSAVRMAWAAFTRIVESIDWAALERAAEQQRQSINRMTVQLDSRRSALCSCDATTGCGEVAEGGCPSCRTRDPYAPCPTLGFMCGLSGDPPCDCCTPAQQALTHAYYGGSPDAPTPAP